MTGNSNWPLCLEKWELQNATFSEEVSMFKNDGTFWDFENQVARAYEVMFKLTEQEVWDELAGSRISELGDIERFDTYPDYKHF